MLIPEHVNSLLEKYSKYYRLFSFFGAQKTAVAFLVTAVPLFLLQLGAEFYLFALENHVSCANRAHLAAH